MKYLNNLDISGDKNNYLLNIHKILIILNKNENKHILNKMLRLHKYTERQIDNIHIYESNI